MDKRNNVEIVFEELKDKGLIDKDIKLKRCRFVPTFKMCSNKIKYNPQHLNQSKQALRFILLHEMGHKKTVQLGYPLFITLIISSVLIIILIFSNVLEIEKSMIKFFKYLIIFFIGCIVAARKDELRADKWAAEKYIETYKKSPSKAIKRALKECKWRPNTKFRIVNLILLGMLSIIRLPYYLTHPTDKKRYKEVLKIEREYQTKRSM